jgi:sporulation-control protein spo0M
VTTSTLSRTLLTLAATALIVAGCGGSTGTETSSSAVSGSSSPSGPPASTAAPQLTDDQSPPTRLVVDVTIKGGEVTPTNEPLQGAVGEPIVIRVNSDAADQLHVHSNPEHTFTVEPKNGQQFQFTVDVPGKVDVELHELKKTVATITVQ